MEFWRLEERKQTKPYNNYKISITILIDDDDDTYPPNLT